MQMMILSRLGDLVDLLKLAFAQSSETGIPRAAVEKFNSLLQQLDGNQGDVVEIVLDLLALGYKYAFSAELANISAPMHEGVYNTFIRSAIPHLVILSDESPEDVDTNRDLLCALIPDSEIRTAMLRGETTTVSLAASAFGQLGYLQRRVKPTERLLALLEEKRSLLAIARPEAFENYLRLLGKLSQVGKLIPNQG